MISGCLGLELILLGARLCLGEQTSQIVVNNYAQECKIIRPSRKDTDDTLKQIATENARCRAAKEKK